MKITEFKKGDVIIRILPQNYDINRNDSRNYYCGNKYRFLDLKNGIVYLDHLDGYKFQMISNITEIQTATIIEGWQYYEEPNLEYPEPELIRPKPLFGRNTVLNFIQDKIILNRDIDAVLTNYYRSIEYYLKGGK